MGSDRSLGGDESFAGGVDGDGAGGGGADHDQCQAMESTALRGLEAEETGRITIVCGDDLARAINGESHKVVGEGSGQAVLVLYFEGDVGEVLAVGFDEGTVGGEIQLRGDTGSFDGIGGPLPAILIRDDFEFAGLVFDVVPAEAVLEFFLFLAAERLVVEEEFGRISGGITKTGTVLPSWPGQFQ